MFLHIEGAVHSHQQMSFTRERASSRAAGRVSAGEAAGPMGRGVLRPERCCGDEVGRW